jgi:hypothetical protein
MDVYMKISCRKSLQGDRIISPITKSEKKEDENAVGTFQG